jgi:F0F1-type ATP synthase assembly protein I
LSNPDVQKGRRVALAVVLGQVLVGALVAIVCYAIDGVRAGASALLGAGIGVAATSLMALAMLRHGEDVSAARAAIGFFTGWLVKVGFTVALLVVAFRSPKVEAVPLLAAYVATFAGYWLGAARTQDGPTTLKS